MNIAFVFHSFGVGGIEKVGVDYIKMLHEHGHKITVYNLNPKECNMKEFLPKECKYISYKFSRLICPELYSFGVKKWWWGKYAYPIIHTILSIFQFLMRLCFKRQKYDIAIAFSGHINDLTFVTNKFIQAKQKVTWCHGSLISYLAICDAYAVLYKKIDKFVTLSDLELHSAYNGHKFLQDKKIMKIYNPTYIQDRNIDSGFVGKMKREFGDFVLMIARVTEPKDHKTAIKAMVELKKRGLDKKIVFVGDGDKLEEIKQFVRCLNAESFCIFVGNQVNVQDYISASYIGLLASYSEGLPTVIIESMAFAKPCVMTDCDGGELSEYGKYCQLVPVGDYLSLADALEKLYRNSAIYEQYAELARERFKFFKPDFVYDRLNKILELS